MQSFSKKWGEKRAGAGEREGGAQITRVSFWLCFFLIYVPTILSDNLAQSNIDYEHRKASQRETSEIIFGRYQGITLQHCRRFLRDLERANVSALLTAIMNFKNVLPSPQASSLRAAYAFRITWPE